MTFMVQIKRCGQQTPPRGTTKRPCNEAHQPHPIWCVSRLVAITLKIRGFLGGQPNAKLYASSMRFFCELFNSGKTDSLLPFVLQAMRESLSITWTKAVQPCFNLAFLFLIIAPDSCFANIGDTLPQLQSRYATNGIHLYDNEPDQSHVYVFLYKAYEIEVSIIDGKSMVEGVAHTNTETSLVDAECLGLAQAITGATNWIEDTRYKGANDTLTIWHSGGFMVERRDEHFTATKMSPAWQTSSVRIESQAYRDHVSKLAADKAKAESEKKAAEVKSYADSFTESKTNKSQ